MTKTELEDILYKTCDACLRILQRRAKTPWEYGEDWDIAPQFFIAGKHCYKVELLLRNATPVEQALNQTPPYFEYQLWDEDCNIMLQHFTKRKDFISRALQVIKL